MDDPTTDWAAEAGLGPTPDTSGQETVSEHLGHPAHGGIEIDSTSADGTQTVEQLGTAFDYQEHYHPDHTVSVDEEGGSGSTQLEVAHGMIESSHTDFFGGERDGEHVDRDAHEIPAGSQTDPWAVATSDELADL